MVIAATMTALLIGATAFATEDTSVKKKNHKKS